MKKLLVSLALIGTFGIYAYRQRHPDGDNQALVPPTSLSLGNSDTTQTAGNTSSNSAGSETIAPTPTPTPIPTPTPNPTPTPTPNPPPVSPPKKYNDGSYTGSVEDAYYGNIQVSATISNDKITNVVFLQYPNDRRESVQINRQADPWLAQEAIQAQSANVDIISGATDTSEAFIRSLSSALTKAKA